jgi:Flp pilus assembly protein TadG
MLASSKRRVGAFSRNTDGGIAIIFALVLVPALTIVSLAVDYGRALKLKTTIQNAADAAVVAAAPRLLGSNDELIASVRQNLDANLPEPQKGLKFELKVASDRQSMEVDIDARIETSLVGLVGIDAMNVAVNSKAKLATAPAAARRPGGEPPAGLPDLERELGRLGPRPPIGTTIQDLGGGRDLETLRSSEEMRRAAAALEAQLKAALERRGPGIEQLDLGDLQRLMRR